MERFYLTFDEFFKLGAKAFFEAYGYKVTTEFELFKLPKKVDVLVIEAEGKRPPKDFALFTWFNQHNLISYKSPADRVREKDIRDAVIYLNGYINVTKDADYSNSTMTILANHIPQKFLKTNESHIEEISAGVWKISFGFFPVYFVDLNQTALTGIDQTFFRDFAETRSFKESLQNFHLKQEQKILDILQEFIYLRIESFENAKFEDFFMPATMKADITELVKPWYDRGIEEGIEEGIQKGKLEGKLEGELKKALETARHMLSRNMDISLVCEITGLTEEQLREHKIIS